MPIRFLARWDQALLAYADRERIIPLEIRDLATWRERGRGGESPGVFFLALFALALGICLTVAIVRWGARRLGLPVQETLLFFGLLEQPNPYGSTRPRRIA